MADVLEWTEDLSFAAIRWRAYGGAGERRPDGELVRWILLKRLESSVAAFRATIAAQRRFHHAFLSALGRGRLLRPADHHRLHPGSGDADAVQLSFDDLVLEPVPRGIRVGRLSRDVGSDLDRLDRIRRCIERIDAGSDSKLERLRRLLDDEIGRVKAVVFTESRTTARYLWRALRGDRATALVDGAGAFLGARPCSRRTAVERFAPRANAAPEPPARERADLLIATDVLSQGLNLHDADRVVSYDLPWNPVRLIQRVGRVDRLGSPFPIVYPYHFLPDDGLDGLLGLLARLRRKISEIGRTIGTDTVSVSDTKAAPAPVHAFLDRLAAGDGGVLEAIEREDGRPLDREERLRAAYRAAPPPSAGPDAGSAIPVAALDRPAGSRRVLLAYDLGSRPLWLVADDRDEVRPAHAEACRILLDALDTSAPPARPPDRNTIDRTIVRAREIVAAHESNGLRAPHRASRTPSGRAARRVLSTLASIPGEPPADLCDRADGVLERLADSHRAGVEDAIDSILASYDTTPAPEAAPGLIGELDRLLGPAGARTAETSERHPSRSEATARLVGVIVCRPGAGA